jgi:microcompartment protein CcmK/EutM
MPTYKKHNSLTINELLLLKHLEQTGENQADNEGSADRCLSGEKANMVYSETSTGNRDKAGFKSVQDSIN